MSSKTLQKAKNIAKKKNEKQGSFISNSRGELKKVTWPEKDQVTKASFVIIILVIFFSGYVAGVDVSLSGILTKLRGL